MKYVMLVLMVYAALGAAAAERDDAPFPARLLPEQAVAVVSASDPAAMLAAVADSPLGKLLSADDQLTAGMMGRLARMQVLTSLITSLTGNEQQPLLEGGCALALLPTDTAADGRERLPLVALFDLSGLSAEAQASLERSVVAAARLALHGKATVAEAGPHTWRIELGEGPDQKFGLSFADGVLRLGAEADLARLRTAQPLHEAAWYANAAAAIPPAPGIRTLVNVSRLLDELDRRRPDAARTQHLREAGVGDVAAIATHTGMSNGRVIDTLHLTMRSPRISWTRFLPTTQQPLRAADFVPDNFDLLIAFDLGTGESIWEAARATVGEIAGGEGIELFDNWTEGLEAPFGVNLHDDIFASMAGEIFFAIDLDALSQAIADGGINATQTPYLFGMKVAQQDVLDEALGRMLQSDVMWDTLSIERRIYSHGGCTLVRLHSYTEPRVDHGFGFVGGYLLMSPRHKTLEAAVDAYNTGRNLASNSGYKSARQAMPAAGNIEVYARTSVVCRELAAAYLPWLHESVRESVERMLPGFADLDDSAAAVLMHEGGITATVASACGIVPAIAAAREIKAASIRRLVALTHDTIEKTQAALEAYYRANKRYPARLDDLLPDMLAEMPIDPFARYGALLSFEAPLRYKLLGRDGRSYALASNGPSGKTEFDLNRSDDLIRKMQQHDAAARDELAKALYRYRPDENTDEQDLRDEGDIVVIHEANATEREGE